MTRAERPDNQPSTWDRQVARLGGHFLQSYRWGEFKSRHGWSVKRVSSGGTEPTGMAQMLFRRKGPVSAAYIPRGPVWDGSDEALKLLIETIDVACKSERAIMVIIESEVDLPDSFLNQSRNHSPGPAHAQPIRTVKIPLLDDESLLGQMRSKTRAQVRQAFRRGTTIEVASGSNDSLFDDFYRMMRETSERNEFGVHSEEYYADFLDIMGDDARLLIARIDNQSVAGLIATAFGEESIYLYGASSTQLRVGGSTAALQFAAMQWGREQGARTYDLWGIPAEDPPAKPAQPVPSKGSNMNGLFRFKTGFGGEIVSYPPTVQRTYSRVGAFLADRFMPARSAE